MVTSSADSIWRRFSSSAPQRRARRWLSSGSSLTSTGLLRIHEFAAERMRRRGADPHIDEAMQQLFRAGKVHHAVIAGASGALARILLRDALYEYPLGRADHALADRARLRFELRLQPLQPLELQRGGRVVRQLRGRRTGAAAVDEREGS